MNTKTIIIALSIIVVMGAVVLFVGFSNKGVSGDISLSKGNIFEGNITNVKVSPGKLDGISAYDKNCIGQPITECDAGIKTEEYGLLNFHYSHNMATQPCIHMHGAENLVVEILDSNGAAKVYRQM